MARTVVFESWPRLAARLPYPPFRSRRGTTSFFLMRLQGGGTLLRSFTLDGVVWYDREGLAELRRAGPPQGRDDFLDHAIGYVGAVQDGDSRAAARHMSHLLKMKGPFLLRKVDRDCVEVFVGLPGARWLVDPVADLVEGPVPGLSWLPRTVVSGLVIAMTEYLLFLGHEKGLQALRAAWREQWGPTHWLDEALPTLGKTRPESSARWWIPRGLVVVALSRLWPRLAVVLPLPPFRFRDGSASFFLARFERKGGIIGSFTFDGKVWHGPNEIDDQPPRGRGPVREHALGYLAAALDDDVPLAAHHMTRLMTARGPFVLREFNRDTLELLIGVPGAHRFVDPGIDLALGNVNVVAWTAHPFFSALLVSAAQYLFLKGRDDRVDAFHSAYRKRWGPNHWLDDVLLAQQQYRSEAGNRSLLIRSMALGTLDYLEHFKDKVCLHPFTDFEVQSNGLAFVCCPSYLPVAIGNLFEASSVEDLIGSEMAGRIRRSIHDRTFKYCRWLQCREINRLPDGGPEVTLPSREPKVLRLSYDPTCNLWCVTCRSERITARGATLERILKVTDDVILPMLRNARSCMMNGFGDVFASQACRRILAAVDRAGFPELWFEFITNGVLFSREEWARFPNIHDMVFSIRVSVDAATRETYEKIRLGGRWDELMENLRFISELRERGVIRLFILSFVYQRDNFREMVPFARLAKRLRADLVVLEGVLDWSSFVGGGYQDRAVQFPHHPDHGAFVEELRGVREVLPTPFDDRVEARLAQGDHGPNRETTLNLDFDA